MVRGQAYDDVNMYDDYEVFSAGYDSQYEDYDGEDEDNFLDYPGGQEQYGDYFFDGEEDEVFDDCRIGEKDKPTFNGDDPFLQDFCASPQRVKWL